MSPNKYQTPERMRDEAEEATTKANNGKRTRMTTRSTHSLDLALKEPTNLYIPDELLTDILVHAHKDDLVNFRRVNRRFRDFIDTTPRLQEKLFRKPDFGIGKPKAIGFIPTSAGKDFAYIGEHDTFQLMIDGMRGDRRFKTRIYEVGSYYKDMYITQPPIKRMCFKGLNCVAPYTTLNEIEIRCESGVKLKHLTNLFDFLATPAWCKRNDILALRCSAGSDDMANFCMVVDEEDFCRTDVVAREPSYAGRSRSSNRSQILE